MKPKLSPRNLFPGQRMHVFRGDWFSRTVTQLHWADLEFEAICRGLDNRLHPRLRGLQRRDGSSSVETLSLRKANHHEAHQRIRESPG